VEMAITTTVKCKVCGRELKLFNPGGMIYFYLCPYCFDPNNLTFEKLNFSFNLTEQVLRNGEPIGEYKYDEDRRLLLYHVITEDREIGEYFKLLIESMASLVDALPIDLEEVISDIKTKRIYVLQKALEQFQREHGIKVVENRPDNAGYADETDGK